MVMDAGGGADGGRGKKGEGQEALLPPTPRFSFTFAKSLRLYLLPQEGSLEHCLPLVLENRSMG